MGLDNYTTRRDHFEPEEYGNLAFPCCVCIHRHGSDQDHPCRTCDHNAKSVDDAVEVSRG